MENKSILSYLEEYLRLTEKDFKLIEEEKVGI